MKRSPMKAGAGLKRTAFARGERIEAREVSKLKRTAPMPSTGMLSLQSHQRKAPKRKATLKSKGPRSTPIRRAARGQDCTLNFPGICHNDTATTVWAHSNRYCDGKGAGLKARDEEGCFACFLCHSWLDGGYAGHMARLDVDARFDKARMTSQAILRQKGLMK